MKVRINITNGPDKGRNFVLEANEKRTIGRGDNVEVRMMDELVSREHCRLEFDGRDLTVCDLGSTNRTFVHHPPNPPQPLTPHQKYPISDRSSFCVGPESWFAVVFEHEKGQTAKPTPPSPPPTQTQGPAQPNSNFSASLVTPSPNRFGGMGTDSSIFNLTGPVSPSPGLDDFRTQAKPAPPKPSEFNPPPARAKSQPSSGYVSGSIVPPGEQNLDQVVYRPQVLGEEEVDESHLKSTPSVVERAQDTEEEEALNSPLDLPSSSTSPLGSLVPPSGSRHPNAIKPEQIRTQPEISPVEDETDEAKNLARGGFQSPFESIAVPGQMYETVPPPSSSPQRGSIAERQEPAAVQHDSTALDSSSSANIQPNGLYFHTGSNPAFLSRIVSELGQKWVPIFCVDLTRLGSAEVLNKPLDANPAAKGVDPMGASASNFEIEPSNDSPFDVSDSTGTTSRPMTGIPLFDFFPEGLQPNGPLLMTKDQFSLQLEACWQQDGVIVFFGNDADTMVTHLKKLSRMNIQSGKPSRGLFGFCWPTVLHSVFESQSRESVGRIFGDCLSCILLEDPLERYHWNLVSQVDLISEFDWLKEAQSR